MRNESLLILLALAFSPACTKETPRPAAESAPAADEPDDPTDETGDDEASPRRVEELSDDELESECYRGRTEACDLLGH
jgi:hypothetical protein